MLWQIISTPQGLSKWFADEVTSDGDIYLLLERLFTESKYETQLYWCLCAFLLGRGDGSQGVFEMRISIDELTKDVILSVTDFAEPDELSDAEDLWNAQIENLKKRR